MAVFGSPVRVPREALIRAWEMEDLGPPHPILGASRMYVPQRDRADVTRRCLRELARCGLADGEVLTRDFRLALRVLASPGRELYGWSTDVADAARDRGLALSVADRDTVALHVRGETAALASFDPRRLVDEFIAELPEYPVAAVSEIHVSQASFAQRDENRDMFASRPGAEQRLEALLTAPREHIHQLHVGGMSGGRYRRSKPFSVVDIRGRGRVLTFADGKGDIRCLPGTSGNLTRTFTATWKTI